MSNEEDLYGTIFEPGAVIFRQGEPGDTLYLIQSGAVEYSYKQGDKETVLTILAPRIVPGTVIVFDEYFNYPGWQEHEHKAFQEFVKEFRVDYKFLGFAKKGYSVGVQIQ